ncbi:MAG: hypothetical protein IPI21_12730 [Propionivibrio sp.]|nr:hypothetical protein [Propionivibrio sp.]
MCSSRNAEAHAGRQHAFLDQAGGHRCGIPEHVIDPFPWSLNSIIVSIVSEIDRTTFMPLLQQDMEQRVQRLQLRLHGAMRIVLRLCDAG